MESGHRAQGRVLWAGETEPGNSNGLERPWEKTGTLQGCGGAVGRRGRSRTLPSGSERIRLMFKDAWKRVSPNFFYIF